MSTLVTQNIDKMKVIESKLCKKAERGCNLSKQKKRRGGPPLLMKCLLRLQPLSALLHSLLPTTFILSMFCVTRVLDCMHFYGCPPYMGTVSSGSFVTTQ